ncbi:MAG: redoxin domain-containing protein [Planctomycetes bacterium]|nr:redoxin domain-containing protein [Planctomycetota bacterium]
MVHLQKVYERYRDKGLLVLGISLDRQPERARRRTRELSVDYPVANGSGSALERDYGSS